MHIIGPAADLVLPIRNMWFILHSSEAGVVKVRTHSGLGG